MYLLLISSKKSKIHYNSCSNCKTQEAPYCCERNCRAAKEKGEISTGKVLAYDHFGVIFDGTPSFAEVEVRECICYVFAAISLGDSLESGPTLLFGRFVIKYSDN
jgi:hypothetical protein